jgi:hypothetical protein
MLCSATRCGTARRKYVSGKFVRDLARRIAIVTRGRFGALLLGALLTSACASPERLTSKATPCGTREVRVVGSDFSRKGVTTAWCAECKGKLYLCATDAERTKVQCRLSTPDDACH